MEYYTRMSAEIEVLSDEDGTSRFVDSGRGFNFFQNGVFFTAKILTCDYPLGAGDVGSVEIGIIHSDDQELSSDIGAIFEVRDGPETVVALGRVLGMKEQRPA